MPAPAVSRRQATVSGARSPFVRAPSSEQTSAVTDIGSMSSPVWPEEKPRASSSHWV